MRLKKCAPMAVAVCLVLPVPAQSETDVQVEAGPPVESPDGKHQVSVDRLLPVTDGEPDRYSGQMVVRVDRASDVTSQTQHLVEASQVRLLKPPEWLSAQWAAVSYNIAKNADGIIFVNIPKKAVLQVEQVGLHREMGESATPQHEVTSFEVTRHTETTSTRYRNVVFMTRSVFPLVLAVLPSTEEQQMSARFAQEIEAAVGAYHSFASLNGMSVFEPEQASEALSPNEKHMALLGCSNGRGALVVVPLTEQTAEATLNLTRVYWLPTDVLLTACIDAILPEHASSAEEAPPTERGRYVTSWASPEKVRVERENFDEEGEPVRREAILEADLNGKVVMLPRAAPVSSGSRQFPAPEMPAGTRESPERVNAGTAPGSATTPEAEKAPASQQEGTSRREGSRPKLQVSTRTAPTSPGAPVPRQREPYPTVAPQTDRSPAEQKPGFFRRLIPGRSRSTSAEGREPPPEVRPTPSD